MRQIFKECLGLALIVQGLVWCGLMAGYIRLQPHAELNKVPDAARRVDVAGVFSDGESVRVFTAEGGRWLAGTPTTAVTVTSGKIAIPGRVVMGTATRTVSPSAIVNAPAVTSASSAGLVLVNRTQQITKESK